MKKKAIASTLALLAFTAVSAQTYQLPNVGFNNWENALAMTHASSGNTISTTGKAPASWYVPNISYSGDVNNPTTTTSTANDVNLKNVRFGRGAASRYIPIVGTLSVGKTWYASYGDGTRDWDFKPDNYLNPMYAQNGTFGGISFAGRPDALVGDFRIDTRSSGELAHVIAYLWNGTYYGEVASAFDCDKRTIFGVVTSCSNPRITGWHQFENLDRAIWNDIDPSIVTSDIVQNINKSSDAEIVAYCDLTFDNTFGWTNYVIPLTYRSTATPSMTNVIVSAGDPWDSRKSVNGNNIWADNLRYAYYSRLAEASLENYALEFDTNTYDYVIEVEDAATTTLPAVAYTALSNDALTGEKAVTVNRDDITKQINVTVTNNNSQLSAEATDVDGRGSHTYNFYFREAAQRYEGFYYTTVDSSDIFTGEPTAFTLKQQNDDYRNYTITVNDVKVASSGETVNITVSNLTKTLGDDTNNLAKAARSSVEIYSGTDPNAKVGEETKEVTTYATFDGEKFEVAFSFTNEDGTVTEVVATPEPSTSSVAAINGETASVTATEGAVRISNYNGNAAVYTTDGRLAATATANGTAEINLAAGLYIVRTGNAATKVIVK